MGRGVSARADARRKRVDRADGRPARGRRRAVLAAVRQPVAVAVASRCAGAWRGGWAPRSSREAWIVDDTGFPKRRQSVGVARQYSGALGKVGNCQVGVSINAATDAASCPLDWRLFLPEEWDDRPASGAASRRARRGAPRAEVAAGAGHDRRAARGALSRRRSLADAGYGEITDFRRAWMTARSTTWSRSRAPPRPTRARPSPSARLRGRGRPPTAALPPPVARSTSWPSPPAQARLRAR